MLQPSDTATIALTFLRSLENRIAMRVVVDDAKLDARFSQLLHGLEEGLAYLFRFHYLINELERMENCLGDEG